MSGNKINYPESESGSYIKEFNYAGNFENQPEFEKPTPDNKPRILLMGLRYIKLICLYFLIN